RNAHIRATSRTASRTRYISSLPPPPRSSRRTLSLHDALPISAQFNLDWEDFEDRHDLCFPAFENGQATLDQYLDRTIFYRPRALDRKSTRLNSSHGSISYAVCCLKNNKSSHSRFRPLRQPDL